MRLLLVVLLAGCVGCASSRPVTVTATRHTCGDVSVSVSLGEF
jgi:hypothetical protein